MIGDTDADLLPPDQYPIKQPEEAPAPVKRRLSPSAKWDAMDIQGRLDTLHDMEQRGMLPRGIFVMEYYKDWEALDMRFGNLLYDVQEKVISYLRKNFEDLD
jgi:hypothetical protein